jgi:hypothetical protein
MPFSNKDITYMWVAAVLMAVGLAPIFPACLDWGKESFVLTELRVFLLWTAAVAGYSSCAALVFLLVTHKKYVYVYFTIAINIVLLVIFIIMTALRTREMLRNERNQELVGDTDDEGIYEETGYRYP